MTQWHEVPLFTVDNPGVSSAELAARERRKIQAEMIAAGRTVGLRAARKQGKAEQIVIDL